MLHTFGRSREYAEHFLRWATAARDLVGAKVGVVPGRILHLWHGDLADRRYRDREIEFRTLGFDPATDLRFDENELWEWSDEAPEALRAWANNSFHRNEDGDRKTSPSREQSTQGTMVR